MKTVRPMLSAHKSASPFAALLALFAPVAGVFKALGRFFKPAWVRIVLAVLSFVLVIVVAMLFGAWANWDVRGTVSINGQPPAQVSFPWNGSTPNETRLDFAFVLERGNLSPTRLRIIPDDRLTELYVNDTPVNLSAIPQSKLSSWMSGFEIELRQYLRPGRNEIRAVCFNNGGTAGLRIHPSILDGGFLFYGILLTALILVFAGSVLSFFRLPWPLVLIILGGLLVRLCYLAGTPWVLRGHDVFGHNGYIEHVASTLTLPRASQGWQAYQPPLYYILAASWWKVLNLFGVGDIELLRKGMQVLSLMLNTVYMTVAAILINTLVKRIPFGRKEWVMERRFDHSARMVQRFRQLLSPARLAILATALFVFWPSNIIHSVRIGNDALLYPLFALGLLFVERWYSKGRALDMWLAIVFAGLGMVTKTNTIILWAVLGGAFVARFVQDRARWKKLAVWGRRAGIMALVFLATAALSLGTTMIDIANGAKKNLLVPNVQSADPAIAVTNRAQNYLWFDLEAFITKPYISPWDDATGRQYFTNYSLKSSLFGEFGYDGIYHADVAVAISVVFLAMLIIMFYSMRWVNAQALKRWLPMALLTGCGIIASMALRMSIPATPSNDFRYIAMLLMPVALFYVSSLASFKLHNRRKLYVAGWVLAVLFIALSVVFEMMVAVA